MVEKFAKGLAKPVQSAAAGYIHELTGFGMAAQWSFYEFFAGGGMARAGLGPEWKCKFANDFSAMKAKTYLANWGANHFWEGDVSQVAASSLPEQVDLVWASFPCQDLSLAGQYRGLGEACADHPTRSGTFWPFWSLMEQLRSEGRGPRLIVLENVPGTITSRNGRDFEAICNALAMAGYRFGALIVDARHFVPQSRPRLFFVAIAQGVEFPIGLIGSGPSQLWHTEALCTAQRRLSSQVCKRWLWLGLPKPPARNAALADIIEDDPTGCSWHSSSETERLLAMMAPLHLEKIEMAKRFGKRSVGAVYKRTRLDKRGVKCQRAEVRLDDLAGCLRTPGGGSSRQTILVIEGKSIRSRLLSPREAARLMGLEDDYRLPARYNDAYRVAGDGVCVPVVRYLACHVLEPILSANTALLRPMAA